MNADSKTTPQRDFLAAVTVVEEAGYLLESYTQLLFNANIGEIGDVEAIKRSSAQIHALLVAAHVQVKRLLLVPDALLGILKEPDSTPI